MQFLAFCRNLSIRALKDSERISNVKRKPFDFSPDSPLCDRNLSQDWCTLKANYLKCTSQCGKLPFFQASALRGRQIRHEGFLLKANLLKCIPSFRKQYASKKHLSAAPGAGFGPGQCVCLSSDSRFPGGPQHKSFTADPHKYEILPARLPTQSLQKPLFPQPCRKVPCRRGAGKGIRIQYEDLLPVDSQEKCRAWEVLRPQSSHSRKTLQADVVLPSITQEFIASKHHTH